MAFGFLKSIIQRFTGTPVDWDDLEEMLIRADLGVPMSDRIFAALKERPDKPTAETVVEVTREEVYRVLPERVPPLEPLPDKPSVILVVGVNGTGKTTSTAKLARYLQRQKHSVMLAAADTFRAAAIEQLGIWADRLGIEMIKGDYKADPAALCFDAYVAAAKRKIDFLICDTAGRLHTKFNLMQELAKTKRSLTRHDPTAPHETVLVVDATTGGNALQQAREFHQAIGLTGVIVTKLDGSGKGGMVVAIQHELGIPTRFIGTGEGLDDLAPFDPQTFVERML
jgi:fused signal recognition particle receptor